MDKETKQQFTAIQGKLAEHDERFDAIEGKLAKHDNRFDILEKKFDNLQTSVDAYLKRTETWHEEFQVLNAKHNRVTRVLIEKGVATEEELSLSGL